VKPFSLAAAITVVALPLLTACADPSRAGEAEDLRGTLAKLPGVTQAELSYTKPVILDSGKLQLDVNMAADADPDAIARVVTTTYEGFSGIHRHEEGDLEITIGDDAIHLRSFEPDADTDAVAAAARHAVTVRDAGSVRADINTQDVKKSPHVFTSYAVTIGTHSGPRDVLNTLTELEQAHGDIPDASWSVQTGDGSGWQLSSSTGFPTPQQRTLFDRLRSDLPSHATIMLTDDFATVQVPGEATPDQVSEMVSRHLALLGGIKKAFYDVTTGEDFYVMISVGDCTFASNAVSDRLKQDYGADCVTATDASA